MSTGKSPAQLKWLDLAAMHRTEPPPVDWVVEGLAVRGALTMLAGEAGTGKSLLAMAAAGALAAGEQVAGLACSSKGRTVIVDAEQSAHELHRRVRALDVPPHSVSIVAADVLDLDEHLAEIRRILIDHAPDLLILDSFRSMWHGDENDSRQAARVLDPIRAMAHDSSAAVVLLHHVGKGGSYRGSTAIAASVELGFTLGRASEDSDRCRRFLKCWKCRPAVEPPKRWLRLVDDRRLGLVFVDEAEPFEREGDRPMGRPASASRDLTPRVLSQLVSGPAKQSEIATALGRTPKDGTTRRVLARLMRDGQVTLRNGLWQLTSAGQEGVPKVPTPIGGQTFGTLAPEASATPAEESRYERAVQLIEANSSLDDLGPERPIDTLADATPAQVCGCDRPIMDRDEDGHESCAHCGKRLAA